MAAYHGSLSFSLQTVKVLFPKAILKFLDTYLGTYYIIEVGNLRLQDIKFSINLGVSVG